MQEILIEAAAEAGAEIRRGVHVREVAPGSPAHVTIEQAGIEEEASARPSSARTAVARRSGNGADSPRATIPTTTTSRACCSTASRGPKTASITTWIRRTASSRSSSPQGKRRVRAYYGHTKDWSEKRLDGAHDVVRFIGHFEKIGMPGEHCAKAIPAGPLATFAGADSWVDHPYKNGVALVGDAASTSDQTWGQGLSLAARDVCVLVPRKSCPRRATP